MGYIYSVTNKLNKKIYIGQTIRLDVNDRWRQHKNKKRQVSQLLFNAYQKYGISNFVFKIICICFDDDVDRFEEDYIKRYNTLHPNGYNLLPGGKNKKHHIHTINILKTKLSGINHPNYGVKYNEERKQAISERMKGKNNPNYGKKFTHEEIEMRKAAGSYIKTETTREKLRESLLKYYNTPIESNIHKKPSHSIKISQYNLDGTFIASYYSISDASRAVNIAVTVVSRACSDNPKYKSYKTAGGFIWKRENDISPKTT